MLFIFFFFYDYFGNKNFLESIIGRLDIMKWRYLDIIIVFLILKIIKGIVVFKKFLV